MSRSTTAGSHAVPHRPVLMRSEVRPVQAPGSRWALLRQVVWGAVAVVLGTLLATGAVAWHEGYRVYAVKSATMTPDLPEGSLLIDAPASRPYHRGDVVTVEPPSDSESSVVTHRVVAVGKAGGIRTKGDANAQPDVFVTPPEDVVGEMVGYVPHGGQVLVYLSHWAGMASLITVVLTLWLAWRRFLGSTTRGASTQAREVIPARPRVPQQRRPVVPVPGVPLLPPPFPPPGEDMSLAGRRLRNEAPELVPAQRGPSA